MLSVIVPVYHVEISFLRRCLKSLTSQSEKDIEVLVVMDGADSVVQKEVESNFNSFDNVHLLSICHQGVSAARNEGIRQAAGEYIAFADADDWVEPDGFQKMMAAARQYNSDIIMAEHVLDYGEHTTLHQYKGTAQVFSEDLDSFRNDILKPQTGAGFAWGKLFSRRLLIESAVYFNPNLSAAEDAEFVFRAACHARNICYIPDLVYHYCINFKSAVRSFRSDYAERYILAMNTVRTDIIGMQSEERFLQSYFSFVLYHLLLIAVNYSYHPENPDSKRERKAQFRKLIGTEPFAEALQHVRYKDFSKTRAVTLWFIVHHQYSAVSWIAGFRHRQFRKFSGR